METIFEHSRSEQTLKSIYGDCLEGAGIIIPHRGMAVVDHTIRPEVGDIVICRKHRAANSAYCKQVKSIGETVVVGTCYLDKSKDFTFEAEAICGVVVQVFDCLCGKTVYKRVSKDELVKTIDKALVELSEATGSNYVNAFILDGTVMIYDTDFNAVDYFRGKDDGNH